MRIFDYILGRTFSDGHEMKGASQRWKQDVERAVKRTGANPGTARGKIVVRRNKMKFKPEE